LYLGEADLPEVPGYVNIDEFTNSQIRIWNSWYLKLHQLPHKVKFRIISLHPLIIILRARSYGFLWRLDPSNTWSHCL